MKKILSFILAVTSILLTGCTALVPSPHGDIPASDTVKFVTQFPVYEKDIESIQVILENGGDTNLEYGTEWAVEKKQGEEWVQIPFIPNAAWTQPLLTLMPGGTDSFYVSMDMLDYTLHNGEYRVVKEVSGTVYAAEFSVGESDISADSPFGYVPLEKLPMDYSVEEAAADGVVIVMADGISFYNEERLAAFLEDAARYVDTQIRFGRTHRLDPDKLLLEDVILEKADSQTPRFTYRTDDRRASDPEEIQTQYYSYLILEGEAGDERFFLTNGSNEKYSRQVLVVPSQMYRREAVTVSESAKEYLDKPAYQTPISAWSPDGLRHVWASPDLVMHFYVNIQYPEGGSMGYTVDLLSEKIPVAIREFVWADETRLMIVCYTNEENLYYYAFYDTDQQKITSYTTSSYGYRWEDGNITFLE